MMKLRFIGAQSRIQILLQSLEEVFLMSNEIENFEDKNIRTAWDNEAEK